MNLVNIVNVFMEVVLLIFGIPGNTLIILVCYFHSRRSSTDLVIGFQAVIDLLAAVPASYAIVMVSAPEYVDDSFCKVKAFSLRYVRYTSLFLMAAIALDRFRVVCRPLDQRWSWKSAQIVILILFCNALGFVISFPNALATVPVRLDTGVRCVRAVNQLPHFDHIYPIITSLLFFLALIVTSLLYLKIYQVIKKQNRVRAAMTTAPGPFSDTAYTAEMSSGIRVLDKDSLIIHTVSGASPPQEKTPIASSVVAKKRRTLCFLRCAWRDTDERGGKDAGDMRAFEPTPHIQFENPLNEHIPQQQQPQQPSKVQSNLLSVHREGSEEPRQASMNRNRPPSPNGEILNQTIKRKQPTVRKDHQTTSMLLIITVIFFVSWIPGIITTHVPSKTLRAFRKNVITNLVVIMGYALRNINHIVNVFVYTLMSRRFKQQCKQVIAKTLRKKGVR